MDRWMRGWVDSWWGGPKNCLLEGGVFFEVPMRFTPFPDPPSALRMAKVPGTVGEPRALGFKGSLMGAYSSCVAGVFWGLVPGGNLYESTYRGTYVPAIAPTILTRARGVAATQQGPQRRVRANAATPGWKWSMKYTNWFLLTAAGIVC